MQTSLKSGFVKFHPPTPLRYTSVLNTALIPTRFSSTLSISCNSILSNKFIWFHLWLSMISFYTILRHLMYSKFRKQIKDIFFRCHAPVFESYLRKVCTMSVSISGNHCMLVLLLAALFLFSFKKGSFLFQALEQSLMVGPALEYSSPFSKQILDHTVPVPPLY